ncbi:MAG: PAS domain S-box protein [Gaiellaceae bacterium]
MPEDIEPLIHATLIGDAVASAPYVVLVADENMNYLAVSDGACALLGYSRADLLRKMVADIVEESDADLRYRRMIGERSQRGRIGLRASDGRVIKAIYEAHETRVAKLPYYVSVLIPVDD